MVFYSHFKVIPILLRCLKFYIGQRSAQIGFTQFCTRLHVIPIGFIFSAWLWEFPLRSVLFPLFCGAKYFAPLCSGAIHLISGDESLSFVFRSVLSHLTVFECDSKLRESLEVAGAPGCAILFACSPPKYLGVFGFIHA
jgi:hypothetical protein